MSCGSIHKFSARPTILLFFRCDVSMLMAACWLVMAWLWKIGHEMYLWCLLIIYHASLVGGIICLKVCRALVKQMEWADRLSIKWLQSRILRLWSSKVLWYIVVCWVKDWTRYSLVLRYFYTGLLRSHDVVLYFLWSILIIYRTLRGWIYKFELI